MPRDNPYGAFNFKVTAPGLEAGFQEVTGLGMEVTVAEYRTGTDPENHVRKINNVYKANDVTLKRGITDTKSFFTWIKEVRRGSQSQLQTVTIELMDEEHANTVWTWKLFKARPTKYTGPSLNA